MDIKADRDVLYSNITTANLKSKYHKYTSQMQQGAFRNKFVQKNRGCPCLLFGSASLTVEAAFGGTVFLLALFSLLYLFQVMERYNGVQVRLADAAYRYECYGTKKRLIQDDSKNTYFVGWDDKKGICYVKHCEKIPYLGSSFFSISWYQQIKVNDYKGVSMAGRGDETGEYVYLADHGKVYHRNRDCVYLKPEVKQAVYWQIETKRNISGGKYSSCRRCARNAHPADTAKVYITPYGDGWHVDRNCSGLKRSARKVLIEEVGGLPPCSKCGS